MTILNILVILYFLLACFDAWLTRRRIRDYGIRVELNTLLQWIIVHTNLEVALFIGILLPSVALCGLCLLFNSPLILAVFVGFRARWFWLQIESLAFERELKRFKSKLDAIGGRSINTRSPLQRDSVQRIDDSTMAPTTSKDENGKIIR